jgi:hypothetical protein
MQHYAFSTRWFLPAKIDTVWDELAHPERWPNWWQGLVRVQELASGDAFGVGAVKRFVWQGLLPYTLTVDMRVMRKEQPSLLESAAVGEL